MIYKLLHQYWGYEKFRPLQEEVIQCVLDKKDTLALLPTGGGKSVCFQIPALAQEGVCVVVSPLLALMKDQVENLKKKNITAIAITSAMSKREIDIAFDNCVHGQYKFLYISPERLETDLARVRIQKMNVNLIAVDEAHCISQWGYDFRPGYLKIVELRKWIPEAPVLALTATATAEVVKDIQEKLQFKKKNILRKSFARKNLSYSVSYDENKTSTLLKIVAKIKGSGIVYVRSRKKTQEIAALLLKNKINADYYHAGLEPTMRDAKQEAWANNKTSVIVCTNAFGMGIDKPDVRFVIHLDLPDAPEAYFQEAGRAGRDEKRSYAVLLYNDSDKEELLHYFLQSFPPIGEIKKTYQALANYFQLPIGAGKGSLFEFEMADFCKQYNLNNLITFNCIRFLEKEGYLSLSDAFLNPSRIHFRLNKDALYKFQVEQSKYDKFIKLILRSYSGVFDNYVRISEKDLAWRFETSADAVKKTLSYLDSIEVLSYIPQTETPKLLFLSERIDAKEIHISPENYRIRKQRAQERLNAMLHYADSETKCRSRLLLAYFDEKDSPACGVCDVCLNKNKPALGSKEVQKISLRIKTALSDSALSLENLVKTIQDSNEEHILQSVQWLMETEEIVLNNENNLCLKK